MMLQLPHFFHTLITGIGLASYGALGHVPPAFDFQLFNFLVTSLLHKL